MAQHSLSPAKEGISTAQSATQLRVAGWEDTLRKVALVLARLALAYLFFTQLFWKFPPTFGCPADFAFTSANAEGKLQRTSGLCDWIGVEAVWSHRDRPFFVADMQPAGGPKLALGLGWAAALNGLFIENFIMPNIRWFGYVIWAMEAFIFVSLFFGIFSRLGGLVALAQTAQLMIGLGGISTPYEWEWSYNLMVVVSFLIFAFAPGRILGVDAWLRPRLQARAVQGSRLAGWLLYLT